MSLTKIFSLLYFITEKLQNIKKLGNRMNEYCWNSIDMGELNKKKENGKLFEISVNFFVRFCNIFSIPQFALWKCLLWRKKRTRMKYEQKKLWHEFGWKQSEQCAQYDSFYVVYSSVDEIYADFPFPWTRFGFEAKTFFSFIRSSFAHIACVDVRLHYNKINWCSNQQLFNN